MKKENCCICNKVIKEEEDELVKCEDCAASMHFDCVIDDGTVYLCDDCYDERTEEIIKTIRD